MAGAGRASVVAGVVVLVWAAGEAADGKWVPVEAVPVAEGGAAAAAAAAEDDADAATHSGPLENTP
jgi:hypothetical protein